MENSQSKTLWQKIGADRTGAQELKLQVGITVVTALVPVALTGLGKAGKKGIAKVKAKRAEKKAEKENKEEK